MRFIVACAIVACLVSESAAQDTTAQIQARATAGDVEALNEMGNRLANGQGIARDDAAAINYYTEAAKRSYAPANFNLGMMHEIGRGVPADLRQAFGFYLKAAQQGFSPAQFNVGNMYASGQGVDQDYFEAILWFRQAAENGVVEAQYNLGLAYEAGRGVGRDDVQAQRWYRMAADQGYPRAAYNLALMVEEGRGSPVNEAEAAKLYRGAAEKGFGPAQNNYGIMLAEGKGGLRVDLVEAYLWFCLAVDNGVDPLGRDMVIEHLSPAQLADANARLARIRGDEAAPIASRPSGTLAPKKSEGNDDRELRAKVAALAAENERLQAAYTKLQVVRDDLSAQLRENSELNTKLMTQTELLTQQLEVKAGETTDTRIQQLTETNRRLNREVRQSTMQLSKLSRLLRVAEAKLKAQPSEGEATVDSDELVALREELQGLRDANARLSAENSRLSRNGMSAEVLAQWQQQVTVAEKAAQDAIRRTEVLQEAVRTAELATQQALAARDELQAKLTSMASTDREGAQQISELNGVLRQTRSDLVAARRETEEIRVQLQATQSELKILARESKAQLEKATADAETAVGFSRELEASNQRLQTQVNTLTNRLNTSSQAGTANTSELAIAARKAAEADAFARSLETSNRRLIVQLDELKEEKAALSKQLTELSASAVKYREEAEQLRSDNASLAGYERALHSAQNQVEDLQKELATLNQRLRAKQSAQGEVDQIRDQLTKEVAALRDALAAKEKEHADLFSAATRQGEAHESLRVRFDLVSDQLQQARAKVAELSARNQRLLAASSPSPALTAEDKKRYEAEIDEAARVLAEKETAVSNLTDQVASLQQDLETSRKSVAAALAAQAKAAGALPNAQAMLLEMQTLQSQVEQLEEQLAQSRANSAAEVAQLADQLSLVTKTNQSLTSANRAFLEMKSSEIGAVQKELAGVREEQAQLTQKLAEADKVITRQSESVAELTGANAELGREKEALELQLARVVTEKNQAQQNLESARAVLAEHEQRAKMLLAQSGSYDAEKQALQEKVTTLNAKLAALQTSHDRLIEIENRAAAQGEELAILQGKLSESDQLLAQHNTTIAELTGVNEELSKDKEALEMQLARISDQSGTAQSEIATLRKQLGEQSDLARRLGAQAEANSVDATRASEENAALKQQLTVVQARLSALQGENARLAGVEQTLEATEQQVANLTATKAALNNAQRELAELRSANNELNNTMRALERDRANRIATLQQDNAALSSRLQQAQGTLDQIASAARLINPTSMNSASQSLSGGNQVSSRPTSTEREHIVVQGDSLSRISLRYYGTSTRWQEIYEANRDVLSRENVLRPGQRLKLP